MSRVLSAGFGGYLYHAISGPWISCAVLVWHRKTSACHVISLDRACSFAERSDAIPRMWGLLCVRAKQCALRSYCFCFYCSSHVRTLRNALSLRRKPRIALRMRSILCRLSSRHTSTTGSAMTAQLLRVSPMLWSIFWPLTGCLCMKRNCFLPKILHFKNLLFGTWTRPPTAMNSVESTTWRCISVRFPPRLFASS
jgi:hypothetical protein